MNALMFNRNGASLIFRNFGILAVLLALFGCNSGGSSGGSGSPPADPKNPLIGKLSEAQQRALESWQNQLIKSCNPSEAFGLKQRTDPATREPGVDAKLLLKKNNQSLVFKTEGRAVILGGLRGFAGVSESTVEQTEELNGKRYDLKAKTSLNGTDCRLYLFDELIFETSIYQSFDIQADLSDDIQAEVQGSAPQFSTIGTSETASLASVELPLADLLTLAILPTDRSQEVLSAALSLPVEQLKKHFLLAGQGIGDASIRISEMEPTAWTMASSSELIGSLEGIRTGLGKDSGQIKIELRKSLPILREKNLQNTFDQGTYSQVFSLTYAPKNADAQKNIGYKVVDAGVPEFRPWSQEEGLKCLQDRGTAFIGSKVKTYKLFPSVQFLLLPCQTLKSDVQADAAKAGLLRQLAKAQLQKIEPNQQLQYEGWDQLLIEDVSQAVAEKKDLNTLYGNVEDIPILKQLLNYLPIVLEKMEKNTDFTPSQGSLLKLVYAWSFSGQKVAANEMDAVLDATAKTIEAFRVSTETLYKLLGSDVRSGDASLQFANEMTPEYIVTAKKALALAQQLKYESFEASIYNRTLQDRISPTEWKAWVSNLEVVSTKIAQFQKLDTVKPALVPAVIRLLKSQDMKADELDNVFSAFDNVAAPFAESSLRLVKELEGSANKVASKLDYARSLSSEFKTKTQEIKVIATQLDHEVWATNFFDSILQKLPTEAQVGQWHSFWLSARAFRNREEEKMKNDSSVSDRWQVRDLIAKSVAEAWPNESFEAVEAIAQLALFRSSCENRKTASARANCLGLGKFSTSSQLFFDPKFGMRYRKASAEFGSHLVALKNNEWITLRNQMLSAFFGGFEVLWGRCDNLVFDQKLGQLRTQIAELLLATDYSSKVNLERKVRDSLKNCQ